MKIQQHGVAVLAALDDLVTLRAVQAQRLAELCCPTDEFGGIAGSTSVTCFAVFPKGITMPTRDTAPVGAPCWIDLMTSDAERSREFYCELFGWTAEEPNEQFGGYFNFRKDNVRIAGCMTNPPGSGGSDVWSVYLATDNAATALKVVTASGGQITVDAMEIEDLGTMAVVDDPGGASIGLWQPAQHRGFGVLGEPGTPSWFELHTRDHKASVDFYRDVFGTDTHVASDTPEFRYTILKHGEDWLAGIMDATAILPYGAPAQWSVYFGADDTDAALAKIVDLGGAVVMPAENTPYGRLAVAADPGGILFKLVAANDAMPGNAP
ncbi:MAG: VOC family protein [Sciscionella sp.]